MLEGPDRGTAQHEKHLNVLHERQVLVVHRSIGYTTRPTLIEPHGNKTVPPCPFARHLAIADELFSFVNVDLDSFSSLARRCQARPPAQSARE